MDLAKSGRFFLKMIFGCVCCLLFFVVCCFGTYDIQSYIIL